MNKQKYDLTSGGILNRLVLISLPVIATQFMQMMYNLTDMFWLGGLGAGAVAASGMIGMYMWLSMSFMLVGRMGGEIGVSQNLGRGDPEAARRFGQSSAQMAVVLGLLFGLVLFVFATPLIGFFNVREQAVFEDARAYLRIVAVGVPFTYFTAASSAIYTGSGNSRIPFIINAVGLVLNMVFDPLLITTFGMGIAGAGYATVGAQIVVAVLSACALLLYKKRPFSNFTLKVKPDLARMGRTLRWAAPTVLENFLFCFLTMTISRFIAPYGAEAMAAQRVSSQIESLSWLIAGGFSMAFTSFVGQNFGAKRFDRIREGFRLSTFAMLIWGAVITCILFFLGRFIIGIFLRGEAQAIEIGTTATRILAACVLINCLEGVAAGAFRGSGRTVPPSLSSITINILRVLAAYLMSRTSLGLVGIFWAISLGSALRGLCTYLWYTLYARRQDARREKEGVSV